MRLVLDMRKAKASRFQDELQDIHSQRYACFLKRFDLNDGSEYIRAFLVLLDLSDSLHPERDVITVPPGKCRLNLRADGAEKDPFEGFVTISILPDLWRST